MRGVFDFAHPATTDTLAAESALDAAPAVPLAGRVAPVSRDYQTRAIADLRAAFADGARAPLLVAPTGIDKTAILAAIASSTVDRRKATIILAPRRELVGQTVKALARVGLIAEFLMAGCRRVPLGTALAASWDTIAAGVGSGTIELPAADLVIVGEAHLAVTPGWIAMLARWREAGARLLGFTATPVRADCQGLGAMFDCFAFGPAMAMRKWVP